MQFDPNAIIALSVPVLAPILTAGVKWLLPKIPPLLLPMICTGLGTLSGYLAQVGVGEHTNVGVAIGLGLAGIGVREILDQVKKVSAPPSA